MDFFGAGTAISLPRSAPRLSMPLVHYRQGVVFPRSKERDPEVVAQYRGVDITVGLPSVRIRIDPSVGSFPV
jgi:hypothetical protein